MPLRNFQVDTTDRQSACATMGVRAGESGLKLLSNLAPSSSVENGVAREFVVGSKVVAPVGIVQHVHPSS